MCVDSCKDLHFKNDIKAINAVPEDRMQQIHIGPVNWNHDRTYIRILYAEHGTEEHRLMVLERECAQKLAVQCLAGLSREAAAEVIAEYQKMLLKQN